MFPNKPASSRRGSPRGSPAHSKLGSTLDVNTVPNQAVDNSDLTGALLKVPGANLDITNDIKAVEDIADEIADAEIEEDGESSDEKEAKKKPSEEPSYDE